MARNDRDLFDRLRNAGLRKQVAKTLSGIGDDAGKKAISAARNAIKELRALADDIEGRLPAALTPGGASTRRARKPAARRATSSASTTRTSTRSRSASGAGSGAGTRRAPARKPASKPASRAASKPPSARKATPARRTAGGRAPRGANKAKILSALASGPKTASEIAKQTGIGVGTVGSTLTKMAGSGEVQKAARGYQLPG